MMRFLLSWISFHGITDIFLPCSQWLPYYSLCPLSIFIPMKVLNTSSIVISMIHFYQDNILPLEIIIIGLPILLYYGDNSYSQYIIMGYMSCIHVPIHITSIYLTIYQWIFTIFVFCCIYQMNYLLNHLSSIIHSGGRLPNTTLHKLLLGIIHSHIFTNFNYTITYNNT